MIAASNLEVVLEPAGLSTSHLETSAEVVYILGADLRIVYCNPAWDRFAAENDGQKVMGEQILGTHLPEIIPQPLRKFYADAFSKVRETRGIWECDFECSSPELYRLFHMRILPLARASSLVENSLRIEQPHQRQGPPVKKDFADYIDKHGIVTMCCHCRRIQRRASQAWDWIPSFLRQAPGSVSHGLCPSCMAYFYSSTALRSK